MQNLVMIWVSMLSRDVIDTAEKGVKVIVEESVLCARLDWAGSQQKLKSLVDKRPNATEFFLRYITVLATLSRVRQWGMRNEQE